MAAGHTYSTVTVCYVILGNSIRHNYSTSILKQRDMCVCVCVCVYSFIYFDTSIRTHRHTFTPKIGQLQRLQYSIKSQISLIASESIEKTEVSFKIL